MPRIVVIGESGQLAQALRNLHWPASCDLEFVGRRGLPSPFSYAATHAALNQFAPDLVLNAAAYTSVDRAESEPEAAFSLNAVLPRVLAEVCDALDIPLVHISTDYVFDGSKRSPYLETDAPNPLSIYGRSKLDGDRNIEQGELRRWAILRTSWVVSEIGETFPVKLLRRARAGEPLRVVDDQWGCPTAAASLAGAMQGVGLRLLDDARAASGLFNFCGASEMSWHGFAEQLLNAAEAAGLKRVPLQAIASADLNAPAKRPAYAVLSCARIRHAHGLSGAAIEEDMERMVRSILAA